MEDGRLFTNYIPEGIVHSKLQQLNNIKNNEDYRRFLVSNASNIMQQNKHNYSTQTNYYVPNNDPNHLLMKLKGNGNVPKLYDSIHDKNHAYGFENSDLKSLYLSRQQLNSKKVNKYKNI